jgi:hypothetical protein
MAPHNIAIIVGIAIINGLFSPALIAVFALQGLWYPFFFPSSLPVILMLCSLIISTITLMVGGIPAAIYERFAGGGQASTLSGLIWFAGVLLLTLPAIPNIVKALGS